MFIYGNALKNYLDQIETKFYCKLLDLNSINFEYEHCNFSRRHMKCRDRNEGKTKAGCGRVVVAKEFGLVHSYTLECGYHSVSDLKPIVNLKSIY